LRSAASVMSGNRSLHSDCCGSTAARVALALDDQPGTVVLDFVDPLRPVRDLGPAARNAGVKRGFEH
jgi:hypothetical protein